tara:strand:- start:399 stop:647 length:249 start_codon:yes stop_codon:yes gene_type:complete
MAKHPVTLHTNTAHLWEAIRALRLKRTQLLRRVRERKRRNSTDKHAAKWLKDDEDALVQNAEIIEEFREARIQSWPATEEEN